MQMMTAAQLAEFEVLRAAVLECKAIEHAAKEALSAAKGKADAATEVPYKAENAYNAFFWGLLTEPSDEEGEEE